MTAMPKGIYKRKPLAERDPKTAARIRENLAKGRAPAVREAVADKLRENAADPAWRVKIGEATRAAMHRPEVRVRHLMGLAGQPVNFRGGNGQAPVEAVRRLAERLEPLGFIREYPIKTKGHGTGLAAPRAYKADFAHPGRKVLVEVDGPSHRPLARRALDEKKSAVLRALGWVVARVKH